MSYARIAIVLLTACLCLDAQTDDSAWRRMLESKRQVTAYLEARAQEITDRAAAEIASPDAWEKVRAKRLLEMRDMLGLDPWPARTPLRARVTARLDKGSYWVENIAFESLPKIYVTGNLYIPKSPGRKPAIVYVCGHAYSPQGDKTYYQRHGISFARNGYVAFILDSIQIAETFALHHGVGWQEMYDWYARGYTPAGVEVWNAMRAIDYLETRPEVDKDKIGMTGRSGGAAMSWFTAAVDPRVKVVAPVMGISTYAANVKANTQRLHCDCMFPINHWSHDMMHQGALIFPRPLLMMHGEKDSLFPVPGYTEFENRVGAMYRAKGMPESFGNVVVDTGHEDSNFLREKAIRWFDKHLVGVAERKLDMDYSNAPPEQLAVFADAPPAGAQNYRVHETFTTRPPSPRYASASEWAGRRTGLMKQLRAKVFQTLPPENGVPASRVTGKAEGFDDLELDTEPGITVRALFRPAPASIEKAPALLYAASDGDDPRAINAMLIGVNRRSTAARMVVYPRGVGEIGWEKSFWKDTLRNAMHTGRTVDSMRLGDVLAALRYLRAQPGVDAARITVMGRGIAGGLALYAAILEPSVLQVLLLDPPSSHAEGPLFLGVLRYTDLPEAAALLAPRRLIFYGRMPQAFEYTRHVYSLDGKAGHVSVSMHIEGILEGRYDHGFASGL
ncbi:MAG: dienelactone hydrolase family protein [Bryobacteraceae bacterium]